MKKFLKCFLMAVFGVVLCFTVASVKISAWDNTLYHKGQIDDFAWANTDATTFMWYDFDAAEYASDTYAIADFTYAELSEWIYIYYWPQDNLWHLETGYPAGFDATVTHRGQYIDEDSVYVWDLNLQLNGFESKNFGTINDIDYFVEWKVATEKWEPAVTWNSNILPFGFGFANGSYLPRMNYENKTVTLYACDYIINEDRDWTTKTDYTTTVRLLYENTQSFYGFGTYPLQVLTGSNYLDIEDSVINETNEHIRMVKPTGHTYFDTVEIQLLKTRVYSTVEGYNNLSELQKGIVIKSFFGSMNVTMPGLFVNTGGGTIGITLDYITVLKNFYNIYTEVEYNLAYDAGYSDGHAVGYSAGYSAGEIDGANTMADNIFIDGIYAATSGEYTQNQAFDYIAGYNTGYADGYVVGYQNGQVDGLDMGWLVSLVGVVGTVLSIQLFGSITLGMLIFAPLVIWLVLFILKMIRG